MRYRMAAFTALALICGAGTARANPVMISGTGPNFSYSFDIQNSNSNLPYFYEDSPNLTFSLIVNGQPLDAPLTEVQFFPALNHGMFRLTVPGFYSGGRIDPWGADIGSTGTITLGTYQVLYDGNAADPGTVTVTDVPEPASAALLLSAISMLALVRKRKSSAVKN